MAAYQELTAGPITAEFNRRAVLVVYNGNYVYAIVRLQDEQHTLTVTQATSVEQATLLVLRADVPAPQYRDTVVIDDQTWAVVQPLSGGGLHTHKLLVERNRGRVR